MKSVILILAVLGVVYAENVALKHSTYQSSVAHEGRPGRAVDGNTDTDYKKKSCTHTDWEKRPLWAVDLKKKYKVDSIDITNREDCCSYRLKKFEIIVTNTEPKHKNQDFPQSDLCTRQEKTFNGEKSFRCDKPLIGRWVVVRFYDDEARPLTLCEVKVNARQAKGAFCHRPNSDCYHHDVATIKGTTLEACQAACYHRTDCMSIQFNAKNECYIKSYACTDKELTSNKAANDYILVESADQCPVAFEYCTRGGVDCKGHDIANFRGMSRSQCQMKCSVTKACQSITYSNRNCYLKDFACANFEVMGHPNAENHIKVHDASECKYKYYIYD